MNSARHWRPGAVILVVLQIYISRYDQIHFSGAHEWQAQGRITNTGGPLPWRTCRGALLLVCKSGGNETIVRALALIVK